MVISVITVFCFKALQNLIKLSSLNILLDILREYKLGLLDKISFSKDYKNN